VRVSHWLCRLYLPQLIQPHSTIDVQTVKMISVNLFV
jgi:hypothetical protein